MDRGAVFRASTAPCLLLLAGLAGCGADPEAAVAPPAPRATPHAEGEAVVQLVGDRVRLQSSGAPRLSVLRRLAELGAFELDVTGIPTRELRLALEDVRLEAALARILDDVDHEIETAFDPALQRERVVALRAGAALAAGSDALGELEDERAERLAALEDAEGTERLDRLLAIEPEGWAVDVLIDIVHHDPDAAVRAVAVMQLGRAGEAGVSEALLHALEDRDGGVVVLAVEALGRRGDPAAVPYLRDLEDHADYSVREAAQQAVRVIEARRESGQH